MRYTVEEFIDGRIRIYDRQTDYASEYSPDGTFVAGIFKSLITSLLRLKICERRAN